MLADVDVVLGPDAILTGGGRAARETAEPLARRLNLPVLDVDTSGLNRLAKRIVKDYKGKIVVVVADPDEIPILITRFQGSKKVPELAADEYDNLYIVSIPWYGKVKTLRLRYGARYLPPPATAERVGRQVAVRRQGRIGQAPVPAAGRDVRVAPFKERPHELCVD